MENSKICSDDKMVKLSPYRTGTGEVIEELTDIVKQELPDEIHTDFAGLGDEITLKEETEDLYDTEQCFNKPSFEIREIGYNETKCVIKEEHIGCDRSHDVDTRSTQIEVDIKKEHMDSSELCKEEDLDVKYENLEEDIDIKFENVKTEVTPELADWGHNGENKRRQRRKKIKMHAREESLTKPKRAGNKLGLVHKAKSKVDRYKCHECSYATKHAGSLKSHMSVHQAESDVVLYKCRKCSYTSRYPGNIKTHMSVHAVDLHKCKKCPFATKHARYLKTHMLVHDTRSEVDVYKCNECSYTGKRSRYLQKHMLMHKPKTEVNLHKCHECPYATKRSGNLKNHLLVHLVKSEANSHKCNMCSYSAKRAVYLKKHMLLHEQEL